MEVKRIFYDFLGFNTELFLVLNHLTNYGYIPYFLKYLSSMFYYMLFIPYIIAACLYCLYNIKTSPYSQKEQKFYNYSYQLLKPTLCYCLFVYIYASLKHTINLPRPYCSLDPISFTSIINFEGERCLSSFPSAHSALALIITFYLWPYLNKYAKIMSTLVIILVGLSRISLAMHYPADILYGIIIGFMTLWLAEILYKLSKRIIFTPIIHIIFKLVRNYI
jgi:membrane-associated phospholipid phosphatase